LLAAIDDVLAATRLQIQKAAELERSVMESAFRNSEADQHRLVEFVRDLRYGTSKASNANGWGNPVLRIPNVVGDRLLLDDLAFVELPSKEVARLELRTGDLLLVRTNGNPRYVGRSVVFNQPDERTWVYASYLIRARLGDGLSPDFVNVFLGTQRGRQELLRRVTTSAGNHNINSNSIRLIAIPVPRCGEDQDRIVRLAAHSRRVVDALQVKRDAVLTLKKSVMDDVLTGRVRLQKPFAAATL
jgi:type I restriction enzyme, S subunit